MIEAVFPEELPEIYSAILVKREAADDQDENISADLVRGPAALGDDRVRAVAMDQTAVARGSEVVDTAARSPCRSGGSRSGGSSTSSARRSTR